MALRMFQFRLREADRPVWQQNQRFKQFHWSEVRLLAYALLMALRGAVRSIYSVCPESFYLKPSSFPLLGFPLFIFLG